MTDLPAPMTPAGCVLQDFPHTPIYRARLFGSSFHARATDGEWRAGVTLWLKSWDQVPAGSLPDDDIELCRLAELARDLKTWKKVKAGALRGWVLCSDSRLYHPVVAEGVNNAIEAKTAQRDKTLKARIAALEKRMKDASDPAIKESIAEEIERLKQSQSQKPKGSVTDPVTASKGREEKGREEKGLEDSDPKGSGGKPPLSPEEIIFTYGVPLLVNAGSSEKHARSFLGGLRKGRDDSEVVDALRNCIRTKALQPLEYLAAALPPPAGKGKPNAQEALEAGNRAVVARMLEKEGDHAAQ